MKLLTKDKLQYWGHSLLHPFDGFFEIRFRNHGSLLIATVLLIAYAILRCLSYQYTGFVMNMNNIDEMDALSIFISTISVVLLAAGFGLILWWTKKKKTVKLVFGIIMAVLGFFGALQALGILSGVPVFAFGIPAVLSLYFDLFSGFVQALVFTLLSMVYIAGSCPDPEAE